MVLQIEPRACPCWASMPLSYTHLYSRFTGSVWPGKAEEVLLKQNCTPGQQEKRVCLINLSRGDGVALQVKEPRRECLPTLLPVVLPSALCPMAEAVGICLQDGGVAGPSEARVQQPAWTRWGLKERKLKLETSGSSVVLLRLLQVLDF